MNNQKTHYILLALVFFLSVRILTVFFISTHRTIPHPVDDHYAYAVKNSIIFNDFYEENPVLQHLKKNLKRDIVINPQSTATREFHQIFCFYHPLYTLVLEGIHVIFDLPHKKGLFVVQALLQVLLGISLFLLLRELELDWKIVAAFFIIISINWGMHAYLFKGMPKNFLSITAFFLAFFVLKFGDRPCMMIPLSILLILISACNHSMAYVFALPPLLAGVLYGFSQKKWQFFKSCLLVTIFVLILGIGHVLLIKKSILPGYLSNWPLGANLSINFSWETISRNLSQISKRLPYFSESRFYWGIFIAGFILGLQSLMRHKNKLWFWLIFMFNFIPLIAATSLAAIFSYRLLPMALYLNLVVMLSGYWDLLKKMGAGGYSNLFNRLFCSHSAILFFVLVLFINLLQLSTFKFYLRDMFTFGQPYDNNETLHSNYISALDKNDIVGIEGDERVLLSAIYNGLQYNPIIYQRYYSDDYYAKDGMVQRMSHYIGKVPWEVLLTTKNRIRIDVEQEFALNFNFQEPHTIKGILLIGKNTQKVQEAILEYAGQRIKLLKNPTYKGSYYLLPKYMEFTGNIKVIFSQLEKTILISKALLIFNDYEHMQPSINLDWSVLTSIEIKTGKDTQVYNWSNCTKFGGHEKCFDILMDDGFSYFAKVYNN